MMNIKTLIIAGMLAIGTLVPAEAGWHGGGWHGGGWHGGGWHGGWHGGYWYSPWAWWGPVVVAGVTYSVVDGVWYRDYGAGYVEVEPPAGYVSSSGSGTQSGEAPRPSGAPSDAIFAYPKNGQSEQQQSQDRYDCHKWAVGQTSFDPTLSQGGVAADQVTGKRKDYRRAFSACLEGRGYTVR